MTNKDRFRRIFERKRVDRIPIYFFGTWYETKLRWKKEGMLVIDNIHQDAGPQIGGMDPDWEEGMWECYHLVDYGVIGDKKESILEDNTRYQIISNSVGDIIKATKEGSSVRLTLEYALKPNRQSWSHYKQFLDANDKRRYCSQDDFLRIASELNGKDRVLPLMGGSFYGYLREYMGVESLSYIMYDDPELFDDILSYLCEYYIRIFSPIIDKIKFDFVYIFEDCCGADGPLFSPEMYNRFFHKQYKKLLGFYKGKGIPFALIDSDGKVDQLIPLFMKSGFDILFPVENGKWNQTPSIIREKYGDRICMFGGVDKHVISKGEKEIKKHLLTLKKEVEKGGFLPIPDHRIPPQCGLNDMRMYIKVFNEVFNG